MTGFVGEVRMFGAAYVPEGWVPCDGRLLSIAEYDVAYTIVGTTYGGDGVQTFAVPDLRGRTPLGAGAGPGREPRVLGQVGGQETVTLTSQQLPAHQHGLLASGAQATATAPDGGVAAVAADAAPYAAPQGSAALAPQALGSAGDGNAHENRSPVVAFTFGFCVWGIYPTGGDDDTTMGEVRLWAGTQLPPYWRVCDGALLPIATHQALFSILGTQYGGNGQTTFALPDLRGRAPVHAGYSRPVGETGGAENVTLLPSQLPPHTHQALATSSAATTPSPVGATWAAADRAQYAPSPQVAAAPTGTAGGSQPHPNMPPYTVLSFVIATQGVYPSRD
ncbi:phage tail protein [Cellulomonas sp. S1-8]|uniref:phage tail protein n=1 Tax=Cellulomonas sp. S1-8 TaxID=2904790 RepID=UPI0022431B34|nr:tail fiber protein [Cellulomonas sp. S1-8]UZN03018.1 tail fiber protein [Cellulomonas sp. S1-8]